MKFTVWISAAMTVAALDEDEAQEIVLDLLREAGFDGDVNFPSIQEVEE